MTTFINGNVYLKRSEKALFFFQTVEPTGFFERFVISDRFLYFFDFLWNFSVCACVFVCFFFHMWCLIVCFLFIAIMCRMLSVFCIRPFTYVYYEGANLRTSVFFLGNKSGIRSIFVHVLFVSSWSKTCKRKSSCSQILLAPNYNVVL